MELIFRIYMYRAASYFGPLRDALHFFTSLNAATSNRR